MTEKRFMLDDAGEVIDLQTHQFVEYGAEIVECLNNLHKEKEYLKTRFHEERELAMRLSKECDTLTIKKQELELEIIRLETIIKTGDVE